MNRVSGMVCAVCLAVPGIGSAQDPEPSAEARHPATAASLSLTNESVRDIVRAVAKEQSTTTASDSPSKQPVDSPSLRTRRLTLKFTSDDRVDHVDCDVMQCYAYAKDGHVVYATARDRIYGLVPDDSSSPDAWLSCQDTNNLLSTFERYDKCRGVGLSFSMPWNAGPNGVNAPPRK